LSAICGCWVRRRGFDAAAVNTRMWEALKTHGPDGGSRIDAEAVSFGHQLLKTTQEDSFEALPLISPIRPAQPWLKPILFVADARINNREQLGCNLEISASEMASLADSALVLRAWQRWGQDCLQHLVGAFAFAVWDATAQQLFLARDHAGERPLYFCKRLDWFAFATTARAILSCPGVSAELDEETLARDLIGLPPAPSRTRFRDVRALAPGECLLVSCDADAAVPRRYWDPSSLPLTRFARDQDYVDAFLETFDEAVRCRLRTTGSVASHLSGGLDSGSVAATAAGLLARGDQRLVAFTSVPRPNFTGTTPRGWICDEGAAAAEVAALYPNIDHRLVDSTGSDLFRELNRAFRFSDRPVSATMNQIWIAMILDQAASGGSKVLLNGLAGNAAISYSGNYILHRAFRSGHWLKALRLAIELRRNGTSSGRDAASQTIFSVLPWPLRTRIDPVIRSVGLDLVAIRPGRARDLDIVDKNRREHFLSGSGLPPLMESNYKANEFGDHNAMVTAGWGIETRDPTNDRRVLEFCATIPLEQYVVGGRGRSLIRRAMQHRLPASTLARRERGLQAADWYESLTPIRAELASEIALLRRSPGASRLLDLDRLYCAVDRWPPSATIAAEQDPFFEAIVAGSISVAYFIRRWEEISQTAAGGA
jgi:asparagine synthase (glutamine-hydrolysing)